jgi:phosphoesterase RecJ-like protein
MGQSPLSQAAAAVRRSSRILIACHVRPDGDALGSLLALGKGCKSLGKQVTMVSPDGVPPAYHFLPSWEEIRTDATGGFDLAISVDADGSARLGSAEPAVLGAPFVIDLDHHVGPRPFGDLAIVDSGAAATGELVLALLDELVIEVTEEMARCLMAAILTDTGSFRFSNVTPRTMRLAARLIEAGASPGPIYEAVYERKPVAALRIAGRALADLESEAEGELVWAALSLADFAAAGATEEDTDGIVGTLQSTAGARVAILFREEPGGEVRVSLRSRDGTNMARVAQLFGGGGHQAAAGCTLPGPLHEARRRVVQAALRELARTRKPI